MKQEEYKRLLAIEEVNTFFTKIYNCWEELENNNEDKKEFAIKDIKDEYNNLIEELKQKTETVNKLKIFDDPVYFYNFVSGYFFELCCYKKGYRVRFSEEDIEYIRMYVSKNKSCNAPVELQSPSETRYLETMKEIKKLKRKVNTHKTKAKIYDKFDQCCSSSIYFWDKKEEEENKEYEFAKKYEKIIEE